MAIDSDVKITINISELVAIRASFLGEQMSEGEIEDLSNELRLTLTWDTLFGMIDDSILNYLDKADTHYGEIAGNEPAATFEKQAKAREKAKKEFEMVDLVAPAWTIKVPRRIKKDDPKVD